MYCSDQFFINKVKKVNVEGKSVLTKKEALGAMVDNFGFL